MTFEWPSLLWGLLLVPLAITAYVVAQRRRGRYAVRFTNLDLLANLVQRSPGWRRHLPTALYVGALTALLLSLARPQATIAVPRDQATVILVMDVSGSMNATDVQPSRLVAAQKAANTFLDQLPASIQVGVVSFAGSAQTLARPTNDRRVVRDAISSLRAVGGTAMGDALQQGLELGRETVPTPTATAQPAPAEDHPQPPTVVLLLSDGANSAGQVQPLQAAGEAQQLGIPVYTIALGTPGGTLEAPVGGRLRRIAVPPDPETLQQIAEISRGRFFNAPSAEDLKTVYQDLGSRIGFREEQQEVTFLFAGGALVLLVLGGALSTLWFNRFP